MDMGGIRLLIADADSSVRQVILYCAAEQKWTIDEARNGIEAIKLLRRNHYHLIILELDLPIISGLIVCEQYCPQTPVIFISRKTAEEDRLAAFAAGGNDFVVKPFFPRELVARVNNLLTMTGANLPNENILKVGQLKIDLHSQNVFVDEKRVRLTPREYNLLLFFCRHKNKAFSRDALLDSVWGAEFDGTNRTIDTHIKSLREKIRPCDNYITTIWGYGYKMELE